jgi:hypothetical protein
MNYKKKTTSGFSLVEAVVVSALATVVFGALFLSFEFTLDLINNSRAKLSALSVANDRMEYFRSLPYDDVGTILGIPPGNIPQNSTTTLNGIEFSERVLVEYVDDPADGEGASDTNGILADYKRVKVEYVWNIGEATSSISLVSNIVPRSIETTAGGGTVRVNVIDEDSAFLPGASVRLLNTGAGVDVTRTSDANGIALFSGAPAASEYEIFVTANISGNEYSTAQTYQAVAPNTNPVVSPFSVQEADVSTLTFQIGELSDLDIKTLASIDDDSFTEDFDDLSAVASSSGVVASGGSLMLESNLGVYENDGFAYLGPITPTTIENWHSARTVYDLPPDTDMKLQFFTGVGSGPYTLIPDSDLPGNSTGYTTQILPEVSELDPITYPSIFVGVFLETNNTSVTPEVSQFNLFYRLSETVRTLADLTVRGSKIIGTDSSLSPLYKYENSVTTDSSGELTLNDLEFDDYLFTTDISTDIAFVCPSNPLTQVAGVDGQIELILVPDETNTLRVSVLDTTGQPLPGVSVELDRVGFTETSVTNNCGQVFFNGGLTSNNDYNLTANAEGFNTEGLSDIEINGDTFTEITLTQ